MTLVTYNRQAQAGDTVVAAPFAPSPRTAGRGNKIPFSRCGSASELWHTTVT